MTLDDKQIETLMILAFDSGLCYGVALTTLGEKYPKETILRAAKELFHTARKEDV